MAEKKRYASVSQMLADAAPDSSFRDEFDRHVGQRHLVKHLLALRAAKGLSQKTMARKLGCSQSKISKLENGKDTDLRLDDLHAYLAVLGVDLRLLLAMSDQTPVDEIKWHALRIKQLLGRLAELAGHDEAVAQGVADFFGEAFFNLVRIIQDSASKLPSQPENQMPYIQIEFCEAHPTGIVGKTSAENTVRRLAAQTEEPIRE